MGGGYYVRYLDMVLCASKKNSNISYFKALDKVFMFEYIFGYRTYLRRLVDVSASKKSSPYF